MLVGSWFKPFIEVSWGPHYGSVILMTIPFTLYFIMQNGHSTKVRIFWLICLILQSNAVFASDGRTAWVTLAAMIILFPFIFHWSPLKRKLLKASLALSVLVIGGFLGTLSYKNYFTPERLEWRAGAMTNLERPASGRLIVWSDTIALIPENLWLGTGIRGARELNIRKNEGEYVIHAHNAVLETLLETGIIGFLAISLTIGFITLGFFKAYIECQSGRTKQLASMVLLSALSYGIISMSLTSLFHGWWFGYLILIVLLLKMAEYAMRDEQKA
jgi:O-antigen ligase